MDGALELALFHGQDRSLFHRLVRDLSQDAESMRWVMAFWLWLESAGHHNFIHRVSAMPGPVVRRFVEEALACLARLAGRKLAGAGELLPCTNALLAERIENVSYFDERRGEVAPSVRSLYKNICRVVFNDACLADDAVFLPRTATTNRVGGSGTSAPRAVGTPVVAAFAGTAPVVRNRNTAAVSFSQLNAMAAPWCPIPIRAAAYEQQQQQPQQEAISPIPEEFRSLFITFSRGYPISKEDIEEFFNAIHGPCVEAVMVERAPSGQMPVYGRVVLRSPDMIPLLLGGQQTAKYIIKGKHLWARIFVPTARHPTISA
ncbi:uncharacterized protein LOC124707668 [Lolium rigidum]|uniref:uncharacterized protein LOC124707668 n=1 Tax=Lolium rigidum TaxID=89674 RepID=UPI001F5DCE5A|nr:uncharacterized protein LOC124707668 [Lolium rigidum]